MEVLSTVPQVLECGEDVLWESKGWVEVLSMVPQVLECGEDVLQLRCKRNLEL